MIIGISLSIIIIIIAFITKYYITYKRYCFNSHGRPYLDQYTYLDFSTLKNLIEVHKSAGGINWFYDENDFTTYYQALDYSHCGRKYVIVPLKDWYQYQKYIKSLTKLERQKEKEAEEEKQKKVALKLLEIGQKDINKLKGIVDDNLNQVEKTTKQIKENLISCSSPSGFKVYYDVQRDCYFYETPDDQQVIVSWRDNN